MSTSPSAPLGVVILAAGRGTRMRSERAKVLHTIAGKPFVLSVLDAARELQPTRIGVVVGHEAREVERVCTTHLGQTAGGPSVLYPLQQKQLGTGDAVRAAMPCFDGFEGDVLILYGDVPALTAQTLRRLLDAHRASGATLSMLTANVEDPTGYGRIQRGSDGRVAGIVEERDLAPGEAAIREINPGIYCIAIRFLRPALARLRADNAQREYYLTDVVGMAVEADETVTTLLVPDAGEVAGINGRDEMAALEARVRQTLVGRWMREGVTFRDPSTAYLEESVVIGPDSEIGPNVQLRGRTRIGRNCRIDGTCLLDGATIGDGVHLRLGVVMQDCEVGDDVVIGPFAHLRPGTSLGAGVHIGNFVETKKARLGAGTKANHLTYLGDVEIGERTNVGAGTITCNYDGFAKHRTVIGSRVQIGSDTQLVAPVTVGDDAFVGAGTTVTRDVQPGSLVLSRVPQRGIPGWVEAFRARAGVGTSAKDGSASKKARATTTSRKAPRPAPRGSSRATGRRGKR